MINSFAFGFAPCFSKGKWAHPENLEANQSRKRPQKFDSPHATTMEQSHTSQQTGTSWLERLNIGQLILVFIVAVATTFLSIGIFTGSLTTRVGAVEKAVEEKVNKETYEADTGPIKEDVKEIKSDVKELLKRTPLQDKR